MTDLLFSNDTDDVSSEPNASNLVWRVLIVDDEEAIHQVTKLVISNIKIEGRNLEIVSAYSAEQAKEIIAQQAPFAMAFVDVVMETDDAGLDVLGDYCGSAIDQDAALKSLISGIVPTGFRYPEESDDAFNDLELNFSVIYF